MKKNPIIFIAMLVALAFTSCQMNTDDTGVNPVVPPAPTYTITVTATNGTVTLSKTEAKAGETITVTETNPENGYEFDLGKVTIKDANGNALSVDATTKSFVMPASNVTITVEFVKKTDGGNPATPTTPTDSTQWNLDASVIKHENGVGKNDGAFHGTITLNKEKANTGDTVTITVTPDSDYELGELFLGPISGEKQSIGKVNSFTMPNYAVEVTARFDPVDGYNVTFTGRTNLIQGHATGGDSSFNEKYKPGEQVCIKVLKGNTKDTEISFDKTVMLPNEIMGVKISITNGNKDTYEKTGNFYNATFLMPSYDITATVSQSQ